MHILIIPAWYKSPSNPLAGVFFEEQARALQKRGHKVGIIVPSYIDYNSKLENDYAAYDDNGIYTINQQVKVIAKRSSKINNAYFLFRVYHKAYKAYVKQNGQPEIIHSHVFKYSGLLGAYINKKQQIPHVFTEHFSVWVNPESSMPPSDIRVLKTVLAWSNKAFAVSHFLKNALIEKTKSANSIEVLPNMINDLFFESQKKTAKSSRFRFINIGNLLPVKNQIMLIKAFSHFIKTHNVNAELYIVGEGVLRNQLENKIKMLGLENRIYLKGMIKREALKDEIQKAHIGVISSIVETFSIAGIEFMSQGLPVISTNCGGPNDYIQGFNGAIVHSEAEMAKSFYNFYTNYKKFDSNKIALNVKTNFSEFVITQALEKAYLEALIKEAS